MKRLIAALLFIISSFQNLHSQDTFSILAFDSITREVGAAGASCVDLYAFSGYSNDFICELFPDSGAIACQASYVPLNQNNARDRMRLGDSPSQLINWLQANDASSNPAVRQYGVVNMFPVYPRAAAFTGTNCMNYKNHKVGPNYTMHGNILLGAMVLDSMEARFKREKGDLACKLMAAMQGANMVGADSRCAPNGSSSLFAFLKVTQPTDTFGKPSFLISLKTHNGAQIEPIDSLQSMFNAARSCTVNTTGFSEIELKTNFRVFPNPASQKVTISLKGNNDQAVIEISDSSGRLFYLGAFEFSAEISVKNWPAGVYFVTVRAKNGNVVSKLILNPEQ